MIHPLLDEDAWCYWVVSVGALLSFLGLIVACICSCRRNENKTTGANRSLPDIPKDKNPGNNSRAESEPQDIYETTEIVGDHSELYAIVQDSGEEQKPDREVQDISQQNPLTEDSTAHQYTRYASPSSNNDEHPYAQVQTVQKNEASQLSRNATNQSVTVEQPSTSTNPTTTSNPVAPPRTRRSSSHNSLLNSDVQCDIQAANAISGGVQANQDLPYMTPPLLMLLPHPPVSQHNSPQQHFSGDSQDSKGYTSISVREPLANIIAQTKSAYQPHQPTRAHADSHYATVSDDSDEMYAAIDEQDKVYTSGSETYAQIQPMTTETQRTVQHEPVVAVCQSVRSEEVHAAPQPPSVDSLRHVAHAHSRQASSSSANSSIINPGSPKPEKRQANSPLPPPPEGTAEVYASIDKRAKNDDRSRCSLATGKSLEDMYAKVMKKKRDANEEQQTESHVSMGNSVQHTDLPVTSCRKLSLIEVSRASWSSHDSVEIQKKEPEYTHYAAAATTDTAAANLHAETEVPVTKLSRSIDAEVNLASNLAEIDHGYEAVIANVKRNAVPRVVSSGNDPNYEMLRPQCSRDNGGECPSNLTVRNGADNALSAAYSVPFKHRQMSNASSEDPGYERVRLRRHVDLDQDTDSEPNYESMPHDSGEPNYASVCRPGDSDTDPNYESVSHGDPNYESVKYMSVAQNEEPPYEQVTNYNVDITVDGYEKVKGSKILSADYEKINLSRPKSLDCVSNGGDTDDEQYVQV